MVKVHGLQVGIEAKIEYHAAIEDLGFSYEQWRRNAVEWMQSGLSEEQVEKRLQVDFNLQWAWADSIATEASQCLEQLTSAKENQRIATQRPYQGEDKKGKDNTQTTVRANQESLHSN